MEVDVATLRRLLVARGVPATADDLSLLQAAKSPRHKLAVTLLSAWALEGRRLDPGLARELEWHRRRLARYRAVWARIDQAVPGAYLLKGLEIAGLYPPGLVREAGDLDVGVRRADDLWRIARLLEESGWQLTAFTVVRRDGQLETLAEFLLEGDEPEFLLEPFTVELKTIDIGSRARSQRIPDPAGSSTVKNLLALLAERWERPFRSRDVLDLALLLHCLRPEELPRLRAGLGTLGLWRPWRELHRAAARLGWVPAGLPPLADRERTLRPGAARRWRRLAARAHPVRVLALLAQRGVAEDRGRATDRLSDLLHRWLGVERLLALGLPLFGTPVGDQRAASLRLERRGRQLVAVSPVGSLLLVGGPARQDWIEEAMPSGDSGYRD
jgi:hypothetical protein